MDSKGTSQCQADLLPLRTVHLQSCSGVVTVSGQCVDVIQPLHEEDSIYISILVFVLYCSCLFLIVLSGGVLCMYIGAREECRGFLKTSKEGKRWLSFLGMYLATAIFVQPQRENPRHYGDAMLHAFFFLLRNGRAY